MSIETKNGPSHRSELGIEELTLPFDEKDQQLWLESVIGFQFEEVERGITPQIISGAFPTGMFELWKKEVWDTYWLSYQARHGSF